MSFGSEVNNWGEDTLRKMTEATQKITLDVFNNVIRLSPVDTGRFRGNWQPSIGAPVAGELEMLDPTGGTVTAKVSGFVESVEAGDVIYLVNNLPYAQRLEDGSSQQAPNGMVKLTVQRFQPIADKVIAQIAAS